MRYIGCKTSLLENIEAVFREKNLLNKNYTLFDAFCGTGSVSFYFKEIFNIILNDNLHFATTYASGRMFANDCSFEKLHCDPFAFFLRSEERCNGFFSQNYSPAISKRMYFSDYNAGRIDYIRKTIEDWFQSDLISIEEYNYLLACLLEAVSKVANVAGVYGAYLKKWDPRALKKIQFCPIDNNNQTSSTHGTISIHNNNVEDIIDNIDCDIIYIDPPYTKNVYSTQYHILETLILDDNPSLKGITGARSYSSSQNLWSKKYEVEILFERVVAKTKASHIVFSYSSDGLMSKDFILNVLKRYCYKDSVDVKEIPYKKYQNYKTDVKDSHFEYIFYGKKKPISQVQYCCPLNYMGGKTNVLDEILPYLNNRKIFLDLFGGGFNVGINTNNFQTIHYNDVNFVVENLLQMFRNVSTCDLLKFIDKTIEKYGLIKHDKEAYSIIRNDYNTKYKTHEKSYWYLYVVILYGFQQQIRFNSKYDFNNPVGESGYNDSIKEKIISFSRVIKELDLCFHCGDFESMESIINENVLVYVDPPYLITLGSYNDGKRGFNGWDLSNEKRLLSFLDKSISKGAKVVISNILEYKDQKNVLLIDWVAKYESLIVPVRVRKRDEVLIIIDNETNI